MFWTWKKSSLTPVVYIIHHGDIWYGHGPLFSVTKITHLFGKKQYVYHVSEGKLTEVV